MVADAQLEVVPGLEHAILATITYRDLFDYPVTAIEIHRYLHGHHCDFADVDDVLRNSPFVAEYLVTNGEFFALKNREALFALRRDKLSIAHKLWPKAQAHAKRLARLPFVRMVAVTGSLAVDNPDRGADIDVMLVTDGGRLWSTRLMAKVMQLIDDTFSSGELCVNHLVSTRALELEGHSLYTAQELTQMVPLYGRDVYDQLRAQNAWALDYLPNAEAAPSAGRAIEAEFSLLRRVGELVLRSPLGNIVENWERRRKLHKYNETEFLLGRATMFRPEATGHRRNVKEIIENAFADRLRGPPEIRDKLRLLFGQAYHLSLDPKLWRSMQPFPPLGSLYAAGVARSLGHTVRVHDSMLSISMGEWVAALQINNPDVVVLYEDNFNYLTKMCLLSMRDAAFQMIGLAKKRGAKVIVCSSDSADEPKAYLDAGADYILLGEGEDTFADALRAMNGEVNVEPGSIPGLAFLGADGELVRTEKRPVIRHVDELPLPAWDLIDLQRYQDIWTRRHGKFALNMVTTRGCPYHCNWCAKPIWGQRYNARSPDNVVDELRWLRKLIDVDHIWFMDDIFGLKPRWISRFADALDSADITIRFKCLSRPDLLLRDGETAALARAGCDIVWMGAESGSQQVLDAMEKGTTVEMVLEASESLRKQGVRVGLFIQFGYPGETREDISATIRMIRKIMPDELGISVSYPLPGTRFYDKVKSELGDARRWQDSDDLAMLFRGPFNTGYYRALHSYVHSDVAIRRAWRGRRPAYLAYAMARRTWFGMTMAVLSRIPHRGLDSLPAGMQSDAAATPSEQSAD